MNEESKIEKRSSYGLCYLDAAVQILYNTLPFRESFLSSKRSQNKISSELYEIFIKMRNGNKDFFNSSKLKEELINRYGGVFNSQKGYEPISTITYILQSIYKDEKDIKNYQELAHMNFGKWDKKININESALKVWGLEYFLHYQATESGLFSIKVMPNLITWTSQQNEIIAKVKFDNKPNIIMIEGNMNTREEMWQSFINSEKEWYSKENKGFYKLTGVIFYFNEHFLVVYYSNERKKWTKVDNMDLEESNDLYDFLDDELKPIFIIFTWINKINEYDESSSKEDSEQLNKQEESLCSDDIGNTIIEPSIEESSIGKPPIDEPPFELPSIEQSSVENPSIEQPSIQSIEQPSIQPIDQPSIEQPPIEQQSIDQLPIEQPSIQPIEHPSIEQHSIQPIEQPSIQPIEQLSIQLIEQPSIEQPLIEQSPIEQPSIEPIEQHSIEHQSIEPYENPSIEQPPIEQPSIESINKSLIEEQLAEPIQEFSAEQSPFEQGNIWANENYQYDGQSYDFLIENFKETNSANAGYIPQNIRRRIKRINVAECPHCAAFYPTYIGKCTNRNCIAYFSFGILTKIMMEIILDKSK